MAKLKFKKLIFSLSGFGKRMLLCVTAVSACGLITATALQADGAPEMVEIPAGEFWMGSEGEDSRKDERPRHKVWLDAYRIDRFEVSGKDFEAYLDANPKVHPTITGWYDRKIRPDMAERPVFGLTWQRCVNYCTWRGKRLPTEAEWERAASGLENRRYPWGGEPPDPTRANYGRCCFLMKGLVLNTIDAHADGRTPDGIYNLAGNIAEWVHDWYDKNYYKQSPFRNPRGPDKGRFHTIRGGAWNSLPGYLRSSSRYGYDDAKDFYGIGCRCARSVSDSNR